MYQRKHPVEACQKDMVQPHQIRHQQPVSLRPLFRSPWQYGFATPCAYRGEALPETWNGFPVIDGDRRGEFDGKFD
jgi:hypothetical protein